MWIRVRGQNGQDDGNKGNKGNAEIHDERLEAVNRPKGCQPLVSIISAYGRDKPAQTGNVSFKIRFASQRGSSAPAADVLGQP